MRKIPAVLQKVVKLSQTQSLFQHNYSNHGGNFLNQKINDLIICNSENINLICQIPMIQKTIEFIENFDYRLEDNILEQQIQNTNIKENLMEFFKLGLLLKKEDEITHEDKFLLVRKKGSQEYEIPQKDLGSSQNLNNINEMKMNFFSELSHDNFDVFYTSNQPVKVIKSPFIPVKQQKQVVHQDMNQNEIMQEQNHDLINNQLENLKFVSKLLLFPCQILEEEIQIQLNSEEYEDFQWVSEKQLENKIESYMI
ncbi:hypothetical protein PPERSA_09940 [Pseudocohnilembus persalinus]|uniref:Uncharacterized protein n=1 Tax=Pseudocohnilembus persalinus TaxID=266149 RepID=A0A0V0QJ37_PSEPJ|nr:hypothetical protein PPERSA_09940 [Pseudocohnilembus persalinus]|eukprot:KRX02323.1 hypothetical protein PPERSA_09940 [Pseudocohnilembus persalinus]